MAETMAVLGSGLFVGEPLLFKLFHRQLSVFAVHNAMEANKWKEHQHREKSRADAHKLAGNPIHGHLPTIQRARS